MKLKLKVERRPDYIRCWQWTIWDQETKHFAVAVYHHESEYYYSNPRIKGVWMRHRTGSIVPMSNLDVKAFFRSYLNGEFRKP